MKKYAMQISWRKEPQAEGAASAKALGREMCLFKEQQGSRIPRVEEQRGE